MSLPMSRKQYCRRYVNGPVGGRLARFNKSYFHGWNSRLGDIGGGIYDEREGRKEGRKERREREGERPLSLEDKKNEERKK